MTKTAVGTDDTPEGHGEPCLECGDTRTMVIFDTWLVCANGHGVETRDHRRE